MFRTEDQLVGTLGSWKIYDAANGSSYAVSPSFEGQLVRDNSRELVILIRREYL